MNRTSENMYMALTSSHHQVHQQHSVHYSLGAAVPCPAACPAAHNPENLFAAPFLATPSCSAATILHIIGDNSPNTHSHNAASGLLGMNPAVIDCTRLTRKLLLGSRKSPRDMPDRIAAATCRPGDNIFIT